MVTPPKSNENLNRLVSVGLKALLVIFIFLITYFVLFPIVIFFLYRVEILLVGRAYPVLDKLAAPIEGLANHFVPYERFLQFLIEIFLY